MTSCGQIRQSASHQNRTNTYKPFAVRPGKRIFIKNEIFKKIGRFFLSFFNKKASTENSVKLQNTPIQPDVITTNTTKVVSSVPNNQQVKLPSKGSSRNSIIEPFEFSTELPSQKLTRTNSIPAFSVSNSKLIDAPLPIDNENNTQENSSEESIKPDEPLVVPVSTPNAKFIPINTPELSVSKSEDTEDIHIPTQTEKELSEKENKESIQTKPTTPLLIQVPSLKKQTRTRGVNSTKNLIKQQSNYTLFRMPSLIIGSDENVLLFGTKQSLNKLESNPNVLQFTSDDLNTYSTNVTIGEPTSTDTNEKQVDNLGIVTTFINYVWTW